MKKKRIFWISAGMILLLSFILWAIFLRPTRPIVSVAERMAAGKEDTRILIVVYSYSGNTRRIAQGLQELTGGDLLEINTRRDYVGGMAAMAVQTRIERATGLLPSLDVELPDIGKYDRILIGGPVWSYTTAPQSPVSCLIWTLPGSRSPLFGQMPVLRVNMNRALPLKFRAESSWLDLVCLVLPNYLMKK